MKKRSGHFLRNHSLSIVSILVLAGCLIACAETDPKTHWGSFFGNAVADWSGSVVIILGTKFLLEKGSSQSRTVRRVFKNPILNFLYEHSLLLFLILTGIGWAILYARMNCESKWGQVVGNIVSEWVQMFGLVFLTKKLIERGSKESR
ncbi:MAG: hypothetical protein ABJC04_07185 [Verrucomicrobiota bacterium]